MENTNGLLPLNLQLFAGEGEGEKGSPGGIEKIKSPEGVEGMKSPEGTEGAEEMKTPEGAEGALNALLAADKALQSQFDRLVTKALATARSKWERERDMTPEQRAEAEQQERDKQLAQREQALLRRELRADALELLGKKGLSPTLIDCVSLTDAASMQASVLSAEKAFRATVDAAVKEKMKGNAPPALGGGTPATHLAKFETVVGLHKGKQ